MSKAPEGKVSFHLCLLRNIENKSPWTEKKRERNTNNANTIAHVLCGADRIRSVLLKAVLLISQQVE